METKLNFTTGKSSDVRLRFNLKQMKDKDKLTLIMLVTMVTTFYAISIANLTLATIVIAFAFGLTLKNAIDQLLK